MNGGCGLWLSHMCDVTHCYVWHDLFVCVTWLIATCDMTQSYVWRDSLLRVTWLIRMCDVTHWYVCRDSFIVCDITQSYVRRDSFKCATCFVHMCTMTHSDVLSWRIHMGWLRLVGSLNWYVAFAEYSLFYRALLQKRPMILGSLLIGATPYWWHASSSSANLEHDHVGVKWLVHMCVS